MPNAAAAAAANSKCQQPCCIALRLVRKFLNQQWCTVPDHVVQVIVLCKAKTGQATQAGCQLRAYSDKEAKVPAAVS
jgi:hypothetical protein